MARVEFQHRLDAAASPPSGGQQPLQLPIHRLIRGDQTHRALGQPLRRTHVRDLIGQRLLGEGDEAADLRRGLRRRRLALGQRDQAQIGQTLRHRLERLALPIGPSANPEVVDLIGEQQHLDPARAEPLQLRRGLQPRQIRTSGIIHRRLVLAEGIVLQRAPIVAGGAAEPRQPQQRLAPRIVLVQPLLQHRAKGIPELHVSLAIAGQLLQLGQHPVGHALLDRRQNRALLNHLAREVQRQVRRIHQPAHKPQIAGHDLRLIGDEHPADIELHRPLAIGIEQIERRGRGQKRQHGVLMPPLGAVMQGQRRFVELAQPAIELGIILRRDLALGTRPQGGAIGNGLRLRLGIFAQEHRHRHMAALRLDDAAGVERLGIARRIFLQMQHHAGAMRRRLGQIRGLHGVGAKAIR